MRRLLVIGLLLGLVFSGAESYAQMNRKKIKKNNRNIAHFKGKKRGFDPAKKYNSFGISLNALNYYGDISPLPNKISTDIGFTRPALGLSFAHRFGPKYQLSAGFAYGTLTSSDAKSAKPEGESAFRYVRNLSFRNRIKELSLIGQFDLFGNQGTYISRVRWTPFIFAGVAVFHHNPQAEGTDGKWVDLQPLGTEGQYIDWAANYAHDSLAVNYGNKPYKRIQFAIPMGIGMRLRINELMDISGEFSFRYLFTDYIDDVSKNYVDLSLLSPEAQKFSYRSGEVNPEVSTKVQQIMSNRNNTLVDAYGQPIVNGYGHEHPGSIRGNPKDNDLYTMTTIRLTYILGKTFHKAKFR